MTHPDGQLPPFDIAGPPRLPEPREFAGIHLMPASPHRLLVYWALAGDGLPRVELWVRRDGAPARREASLEAAAGSLWLDATPGSRVRVTAMGSRGEHTTPRPLATSTTVLVPGGTGSGETEAVTAPRGQPVPGLYGSRFLGAASGG